MSSRRVRSIGIALSIIGLLAFAGSATVAQEATPVPGAVLPPDATFAGLTLGEWHAQSWQRRLSFPLTPDQSPIFDATGALCGVGQHGPVFFLEMAFADVERHCLVPSGLAVFVPVLGMTCDTTEPPPLHGTDETSLRACATAYLEAELTPLLRFTTVTVDGIALTDLAAYRAPTPLFQVAWAASPDNPARVSQAVGDGYVFLLSPLPVGEHVIQIVAPVDQGRPVHITYRLTVASGAAAEGTASPAAV